MKKKPIWPLKKLVLSYCSWRDSSKGVREFMESHLPFFKECNPHVEVETRHIIGQHPRMGGIYKDRNDKTVGVKNMTAEQVLKRAMKFSLSLRRKMSQAGVWDLQKLVVSYCNSGGSSRGVREFMESELPAFKEYNPQLQVKTRHIAGQHPHLEGIYRNKNERIVCVRDMTSEEVLDCATKLMGLRRGFTRITLNSLHMEKRNE